MQWGRAGEGAGVALQRRPRLMVGGSNLILIPKAATSLWHLNGLVRETHWRNRRNCRTWLPLAYAMERQTEISYDNSPCFVKQ